MLTLSRGGAGWVRLNLFMDMEDFQMQIDKCYMCDKDATSVEHVPPKCLFPEFKDSGSHYRINLITVPSCDLHNGKKSSDDEFLMVSIAGILGNNSIGYEHYHGKIQRSLKRSSYKLLKQVFLKGEILRVADNNKFMDLLWGTPDHPRLMDCFRHIAYGIHRYHFGINFTGKIKPYLSFIHPAEDNPQEFKKFIEHKASMDLDGKTKHGHNQEVFYYQFTDSDKYGLYLGRLCFYQNVNVYISYLPEGFSPPFDLGMELLNSGIETTIILGDKEYKFNQPK